MKTDLFGPRAANLLASALLAALVMAGPAAISADSSDAQGSPQQERGPMTQKAAGTFEVTLQPLSEPDSSGGTTLGRMSIDKKFSGDLVGTGKGEMLSAMSGVKGSAGYVAIERVEGSLEGKEGSFVLQHSGTMTRGEPDQAITVVPDSGTGELAGISGTFIINIVEGKHFYEFEYQIPE